MGLTAVGLTVFIFLNEETPLALIIGNLALIGLGLALFASPNTNAVMSSAPKTAYGVASAILATMRQVGMVFGMGLAMLMFALYIGKIEITPQYYPLFQESMRMSFIIFAALCFGGIFASLARGRVRQRFRSVQAKGVAISSPEFQVPKSKLQTHSNAKIPSPRRFEH